jgi:hypothetical protein
MQIKEVKMPPHIKKIKKFHVFQPNFYSPIFGFQRQQLGQRVSGKFQQMDPADMGGKIGGTTRFIIGFRWAVDPDSMNPDPDTDPAFQVLTDPDSIRIQGFDDQKLKKKYSRKLSRVLMIKNCR